MQNKVLKSIKKYNLIEDNDKIVLGVSGGPDSISMLNILNELRNDTKELSRKIKFDIVVAHINHKIRSKADEEEEFVKEFCRKINVEFFSKQIDILKYAKENGIGTEEAGRNIRYNFFEEVLTNTNSNKIAIAHNINDKAETIIMNIVRGSGISGLKGIDIKREKYIRPLLECSRDEIEAYCEENKLNTKIDESNFQNIYRRNKIRNVVIPYIKEEFNPSIVESLNRLSNLVIEEDEYIKKIVEKEFENLEIKNSENNCEIQLDLKKFNNNERFIKAKIILYAITKLFGSSKQIEKVHIDDIILLIEKNIGNKYLMPNKNTKIYVNKGIIYLKKVNNL